MGQSHSDEYGCEDGASDENRLKDASKKQGRRIGGKEGKNSEKNEPQNNAARKLSNVSNRNIQLLSMKNRSERDNYADNLRQRRRSSLINLILGAASSGPRFCDDLCSLNSHLSECNFGIEYFGPTTFDNNHAYCSKTASIASSLAFKVTAARSSVAIISSEKRGPDLPASIDQHPDPAPSHRRRSSLGSFIQPRSSHLAHYTCHAQDATDNDPVRGADRKSGFCVGDLIPARIQRALAGSQAPKGAGDNRSESYAKPISSGKFSAAQFASIDLTSSFDKHSIEPPYYAVDPIKACKSVPLRRCGSELSLYSCCSSGSTMTNNGGPNGTAEANRLSLVLGRRRSDRAELAEQAQKEDPSSKVAETRTIIMLQVCLPFIFAGFGNVGAGLVLNWIAHWSAFKNLPIFFVLLPPFVGLKGNIEMTFASRLSTLAHLNLLDTRQQWRQAFVSNLILMLSQAIGLSLFASTVSILCETFLLHNAAAAPGSLAHLSLMVVLPSALCTSLILVLVSSVVVSASIWVAKSIRVNPDNFSTLVAALYGDATCVLTYGLVAELMYSIHEKSIIVWPLAVIVASLLAWPPLWYLAFKFKETRAIALSSMPAIMGSISISIGSGAILSQVVERFTLIALYQPVVNGFGANLIAVQASRVSTWLWCGELRKISQRTKHSLTLSCHPDSSQVTKKLSSSLASFVGPTVVEHPSKRQESPSGETAGAKQEDSRRRFKMVWRFVAADLPKLIVGQISDTVLWSFCNKSPNSTAARLMLIAIIPAHTIYFIVIWLLSSRNYVIITWQFYLIYIALCLVQVFVLLAICEPLMTLLMNCHWDPDTLGISLLMALADLVGTLCLAAGFCVLANVGDKNAALHHH